MAFSVTKHLLVSTMALDVTTFETIVPSRFLTFTIPNPTLSSGRLLRVAVHDSPAVAGDTPQVAAIFVPQGRESDWIFSSESGHLQLLLSSPGVSRLILIGDNPANGPDSQAVYYKKERDALYSRRLGEDLRGLLIALSPRICVGDRLWDVPVLEYEDNVKCSVVLEKRGGVFVGEMLVEDVEVDGDGDGDEKEFRRRLRFKRMPNLVQTEIRIVPEKGFGLDCAKIGGGVLFRPDVGVLVHSYLIPMVASLSLIGTYVEDRVREGLAPKALCLGVGGGALLSFLRAQLGFQVYGVEIDKEVLQVARKYFGLDDCGIRIHLGNAIEFLEKLAGQGSLPNFTYNMADENCNLIDASCFDSQFDVVMVDLDACDARNGISAPSVEFVQRHILLAARSVLCDFGMLVVNVIPPCRLFYDTMICEFREIFDELYEIDVGNGENFVLIAKMSSALSLVGGFKNSFLNKLRLAILGKYMGSIRKI